MRPLSRASARIVARALLSHTTPSTAFRGFGTPQASWAVESQLNEAAEKLGIDPVDIRRRNLPAKGEVFRPDDTPADGDWNAALYESGRSASDGTTPIAPNRGRGVSLGLKSSSTASRSDGDRAAPFRRQRVRSLRHVGHGTGRAHGAAADRRAGARHRSRSHRHRHGRHLGRSVRLVDVGQPIDRLHGQRGDRGVPQRQDGSFATPPTAIPGAEDMSTSSCSRRISVRLAAKSSASAKRATLTSPGIRSAAARRSGS